ncbi:MAG: VPLPA-CTERM sorting domain-containing protein [Steroidobacteraceae bacterium]
MILFAEVVDSTDTAVASYAADTGVTVAQAYAGINATFAGDANLTALFNADVSGDTLVWGVEGGIYTGNNTTGNTITPGVVKNVTTATNPAQIPTKTNGNLITQNAILTAAINSLNTNFAGANSVEGASPSSAGIWDITGASQIYNWNGGGPTSELDSAVTGTGSQALYDMTGTGSNAIKLALVTNGSVAFSEAGLTFTANAVPLPPAVWMFGSGLLGLVGVARRKVIKA